MGTVHPRLQLLPPAVCGQLDAPDEHVGSRKGGKWIPGYVKPCRNMTMYLTPSLPQIRTI
jgi:hypothetical protein